MRYLIHVPKTAGMAVGLAIQRALPPNRWWGIYRMPEGSHRAALMRLDPAIMAGWRVIFGHFAFGLDRALGQPGRYAVILRDPLARAISQYQYERDESDRLHAEAARSLSIADFYDARLSPEMENTAAKMLAGTLHLDHVWSESETLSETALYERALANLHGHFDVVGTVERLPDWLPVLADWLGVPRLILPRVNVGMQPADPAALSGEQRRRILTHFAVDMALYEEARRLWVPPR